VEGGDEQDGIARLQRVVEATFKFPVRVVHQDQDPGSTDASRIRTKTTHPERTHTV
jgi:hypothetical protein